MFVSGVSIPGGGEVVSHYNNPSGTDLVLVTNSLARTSGVSHKINIYSLAASGALTFRPSLVKGWESVSTESVRWLR